MNNNNYLTAPPPFSESRKKDDTPLYSDVYLQFPLPLLLSCAAPDSLSGNTAANEVLAGAGG